MWKINAQQGYPLCDFHKISRFCTPFQVALAVKISLDLLEGLWSYGGFKLTGSGYPANFQRPLAAKLCVGPQCFRGARTCLRSSITMPSLVGHGFNRRLPRAAKNVEFLWLPCAADADIIFLPCGFFFLSIFFSRA